VAHEVLDRARQPARRHPRHLNPATAAAPRQSWRRNTNRDPETLTPATPATSRPDAGHPSTALTTHPSPLDPSRRRSAQPNRWIRAYTPRHMDRPLEPSYQQPSPCGRARTPSPSPPPKTLRRVPCGLVPVTRPSSASHSPSRNCRSSLLDLPSARTCHLRPRGIRFESHGPRQWPVGSGSDRPRIVVLPGRGHHARSQTGAAARLLHIAYSVSVLSGQLPRHRQHMDRPLRRRPDDEPAGPAVAITKRISPHSPTTASPPPPWTPAPRSGICTRQPVSPIHVRLCATTEPATPSTGKPRT
jgi:hypothetical protein